MRRTAPIPFFSPSTRGFYTVETHSDRMPADAVAITSRLHRALLAAQEAGAEIRPGPSGRPVVRRPGRNAAERRDLLVAQIKAEARRRIQAIAPAWRQANDNADIALAALQDTTGLPITVDLIPAVERRERINAVRAASDRLEAIIAALPAAGLAGFDVQADDHWKGV